MHKKFFLVTAIVLAAAAGLSAAVLQATGSQGRHGGRENKRLARMTEALNLTETQQSQIKAILETERAKTQPLRQQLRQNRLAQAANSPGAFDEGQVRAFAARQAQITSDLTVERERAKSQIYAVLTPDQRAKAQTFMQQHRQRRMHQQSQPPVSTTPG